MLRLTATIAGVDVADLLKRTGSAGGITGRLGGTVSLVATGSDGRHVLLRTAKGTIAAVVSNGSMPHLDLVRTVVLAFGKPSGSAAEGSGTAFDRLGGTFALAGGTLRERRTFAALARLRHQRPRQSRDRDRRGRRARRRGALAGADRPGRDRSAALRAGGRPRHRTRRQSAARSAKPTRLHRRRRRRPAARFSNELKRRATDFLGGLFKKKKGGGV